MCETPGCPGGSACNENLRIQSLSRPHVPEVQNVTPASGGSFYGTAAAGGFNIQPINIATTAGPAITATLTTPSENRQTLRDRSRELAISIGIADFNQQNAAAETQLAIYQSIWDAISINVDLGGGIWASGTFKGIYVGGGIKVDREFNIMGEGRDNDWQATAGLKVVPVNGLPGLGRLWIFDNDAIAWVQTDKIYTRGPGGTFINEEFVLSKGWAVYFGVGGGIEIALSTLSFTERVRILTQAAAINHLELRDFIRSERCPD